jgi:hypothetical protein
MRIIGRGRKKQILASLRQSIRKLIVQEAEHEGSSGMHKATERPREGRYSLTQ